MMRTSIPYNLARRPRLDSRRFALRLALLLAVMAALNLLAVRQLARVTARNLQMPDLRTRVRALPRLQSEALQLEQAIAQDKQRWGARVKWSNDLIGRKTFDYLGRLDFLERLLPDGVQVAGLVLNGNSRRTIALTVATPSFTQLLELYRRLAPYRPVITNESNVQGTYQVMLRVEYPDETN
jgi:hypothetical protein